MKIIYIAHPVGAGTKEGIEANLADLRRIIKKVNLETKNIIPFCPYYADVVSMDDNNSLERKRGIMNDTKVLKSGIIDELWLTGDRVSKGMTEELELCMRLGIKIVDKIKQL